MVCGGIVVIGPDGVPRPGTPYVAPPESPASVRFAGSPLVTISDFLAEFELLHLAEPLKASGAPAELYLAEGLQGHFILQRAALHSSTPSRPLALPTSKTDRRWPTTCPRLAKVDGLALVLVVVMVVAAAVEICKRSDLDRGPKLPRLQSST